MLIAILVFSIITFFLNAIVCFCFALITLLIVQEDKQNKKGQKEMQDAEKMATCKDDEINVMQEKK